MTCFVQWDISRSDMRKGWKWIYLMGFSLSVFHCHEKILPGWPPHRPGPQMNICGVILADSQSHSRDRSAPAEPQDNEDDGKCIWLCATEQFHTTDFSQTGRVISSSKMSNIPCAHLLLYHIPYFRILAQSRYSTQHKINTQHIFVSHLMIM